MTATELSAQFKTEEWPAKCRALLTRALNAGLDCAKACPLNTTYHERVILEALALLKDTQPGGAGASPAEFTGSRGVK